MTEPLANVLIARIQTGLLGDGVRRGGAGSFGFPRKAHLRMLSVASALRGGVKYDVHEITAFQLCPRCVTQMPVR
jgi:hypothetical protein